MVLENLCRSYTLPNILDLKLGTRQYSDNATEEKKAQQIEKCDKSTSKKLGMRLCGLQYFDETLGAFQYLDKYFGRSLSEKQLFSLLSHFFRFANNDQVRTNDCLSLIEQIEQIKKV
jgi:inositol-hexakisphosphate kinase